MVGTTGFEPATSSPPAKRATKLRQVPVFYSPESRTYQAGETQLSGSLMCWQVQSFMAFPSLHETCQDSSYRS